MSKFNELLKDIKNNMRMSESQKIRSFNELCEEFYKEPILLRLSGSIRNRFIHSNYIVTFTNTRIIISKKGSLQNLLGIGYVAGLGPYLYYILSDKMKLEDVKLKDSFVQNAFSTLNLTNDIFLDYKEISKLVFHHGVETLVTNMLGSGVNENVLKIYTSNNSYDFIVSAKKNGEYKKIYYWLRMTLPVTIHQK
jgi:hypothetical protein